MRTNKEVKKEFNAGKDYLNALKEVIPFMNIGDKERVIYLIEQIHNIYLKECAKKARRYNSIIPALDMTLMNYTRLLTYKEFKEWYMNRYYDYINSCHVYKTDIPKDERPKSYQIRELYKFYQSYYISYSRD